MNISGHPSAAGQA